MSEQWTTVIKADAQWFDLRLKELYKYRDLIGLFVKRDFTVQYKQTILGPLWFVINPLLTTGIYTIVFGGIAGLSTEGTPQFVFYLISYALWMYFSTCVTQTANTFVGNAGIFGKVYFPRLTMPIATVLFSLVNFGVVFLMGLVVMGYYIINGNKAISPNLYILLVPILILQTALLGLGFGIIVSALTTKYRDLAVLVSFGIQLWMYATPVVYPVSILSENAKKVIMLNPMTPIIQNFRYALLGVGEFDVCYWLVSIVVTCMVLFTGVLLFNRIERTFMDTV